LFNFVIRDVVNATAHVEPQSTPWFLSSVNYINFLSTGKD
jgi:hypothetical protein